MAAMHEADDWMPFLDRLGDAAAAAILPHFRTRMDVDNKLAAGFDPVTVADRAAEEAMRALIAAEHPDHGVLGEEFAPVALDAEHVWVLDPIDGTRAFISGLPVWGTLIGLKKAGRPVAGMMVEKRDGPGLGDHETATRERKCELTRLWRGKHAVGHIGEHAAEQDEGYERRPALSQKRTFRIAPWTCSVPA